jgi:hypothetical protein
MESCVWWIYEFHDIAFRANWDWIHKQKQDIMRGSRLILNMLKIFNFVNCEPINQFTIIYPCETSVETLFKLYLGIPSIGCTQDILT